MTFDQEAKYMYTFRGIGNYWYLSNLSCGSILHKVISLSGPRTNRDKYAAVTKSAWAQAFLILELPSNELNSVKQVLGKSLLGVRLPG